MPNSQGKITLKIVESRFGLISGLDLGQFKITNLKLSFKAFFSKSVFLIASRKYHAKYAFQNV